MRCSIGGRLGIRASSKRVARIVARVRREGDRAVLDFARRFDALDGPIEVTRAEMASRGRVDRAGSVVGDSCWQRSTSPGSLHGRSRKGWTVSPAPGVRVQQRVLPLDRVGCYVPGGRYPLPSSLLMTAIPASIAGVRDIVAVCPRVDRTVMAAAMAAGVTRLLRVGGAHAIAALAYGTKTIPRVDKIVGPGNAYVAAAKALVAPDCAIDFFAGPSEIAIVSSAGQADVDRGGPAGAGRARSRRPRDPLHAIATPGRGGERRGGPPDAGLGARRESPSFERRHRPGAFAGRRDRTLPADGARACGVRLGDASRDG